MFNQVDLPDPEGPMRATYSPRWISNDTSRNALDEFRSPLVTAVMFWSELRLTSFTTFFSSLYHQT